MLSNTSYNFPVDSILLLGPTGVGKSPLGDIIAQNGLFGRRCHHLDFGSELRGAVSIADRSVAYEKKELDFIHGVLELGLLLENEHFPLAEKIISLYLDRVGFSRYDVLVLNGIPRHRGQARDVATIAAIHAVVVLDCSPNNVMYRIQGNIGGDRTDRIDDNKELIEKKLSIFRERTTPLIDHYTQQGSALYRVSVLGDMMPSEIYFNVSALAAAYPPIALVTEPPQR
jgi:adenylate kinase